MNLTQAGDTVLANKDIQPLYRLYINSTEAAVDADMTNNVYNRSVVSYSHNKSKEFGVASMEVELENGDGRYSPNGASAIELGWVCQLKEGLNVNGTVEWFNKFRGVARQRPVEKSGGKNSIHITFLDYVIKLEGMDYDHAFDSLKTQSDEDGEKANANAWPAPNQSMSNIFNFVHDGVEVKNICQKPLPIVKIVPRGDNPSGKDPKYSGFEIHYETGQVIFNDPLPISGGNAFDVFLTFSYYASADANYAEDVIRDIIITPDEYNNNVFTAAANLTSSFLVEESSLNDYLTPNLVSVTIEGTTYATPGQVWWLSYDNLSTTLVAPNFTIGGGGVFGSFNKRFGALILTAPISASSVVTCNVDYSFCTLQATGIQVPYVDLTTRSITNRFNAIQKVKELCPPNYIIMTRGGKQIWGKYLNQKVNADYTLRLIKSLSYAEDTDIYTRVKVYGQSNDPHNLIIDNDVTFSTVPSPPTQATKVRLAYITSDGDYFVFGCETSSGVMDIITNDSDSRKLPKLYIDDVMVGSGQPAQMIDQQIGLWFNYDEGPVGRWYVIFPQSHLVVDNNHPILLFDGNGTEVLKISASNYDGLDVASGEWRLPGNYDASKNYFYVGLTTPFSGLKFLNSTEGQNYNLGFEIYTRHQIYPEHATSATYEYGWQLAGGAVGGIDVAGLLGWNLPAAGPENGVGDDGGYFSWNPMQSFYTWHPSLPNWVPCVLGDNCPETRSLYWMRVITNWKPSQVAVFQKVGAVVGGSSITNGTATDLSSVLEYNPGTGIWNDYTLAAKNGSGGIVFLSDADWHKTLHSATYWVQYPDTVETWKVGKVDGMGDREFFFINRRCFPGYPEDVANPGPTDYKARAIKDVKVEASFWYQTKLDNNFPDSEKLSYIKDGDTRTQYQSVYGAPIATDSIVFRITFNGAKTIDIIDLTQGFYCPDTPNGAQVDDTTRRFDVNNTFSLEYTLDGATFYPICSEGTAFKMSGGENKSFGRDVLGEDFRATALQLKVVDSQMVNFQEGRWVIPIANMAVWENSILKGQAWLANTTVNPISATDPIQSCQASLADPDNLRTKFGDKVFKDNTINIRLDTRAIVRERAYQLLREYTKNHTRAKTEVVFSPHLELGQTVEVVDITNNVSKNYFIDGIDNSTGAVTLQLAYYP